MLRISSGRTSFQLLEGTKPLLRLSESVLSKTEPKILVSIKLNRLFQENVFNQSYIQKQIMRSLKERLPEKVHVQGEGFWYIFKKPETETPSDWALYLYQCRQNNKKI